VTPRIVILSAPSGGGKTVVTKELLKRHPELFGYSVSATTRQPRPGEKDGQAYHFLTRQEFERRQQAGEFLETAEYAGELYGTLKSEIDRVLSRGLNVLLDIEVKGANQVREAYRSAISVFLLPPSAAVLLDRLRGRQTESPEALAKRVAIAIGELRAASTYDHEVVNADLNRTVEQVLQIVENPERRTQAAPEMFRVVEELAHGLVAEVVKLHDQLKESR
jgi:guanylate kinase